MDRIDIYASVHKGLRAELFQVAQQIGRTDFHAPHEVVELSADIRGLFGFLDEHARHEDRFLMPEIQRVAPWAHVELAGEHARLEGHQKEIEGLLRRIESVEICERVSLGQRLLRLFNGFVAEQIQHMEREETTGNRALWAHRTDEELLALHGQLIDSIDPIRLLEWAEIMAPALSAPELARLSAGLNGILPTDALATIPALAIRGAAS